MPNTIRSRILDYLKKNLSASALELSTVLGVTKPNIQYHLKKLLQENMVEAISDSSASLEQRERGRPVKFYRLSISKTPDDFAHLSQLLLTFFLMERSSEDLAKNISGLFDLEIKTKKNLTDLFNKIINQLNEHFYNAHWEIHNNGPRVIFRNCPYAVLVSEFPLLCEMDRLILEQNAECKTRLIHKADPFSQKPSVCIFQLTLNS